MSSLHGFFLTVHLSQTWALCFLTLQNYLLPQRHSTSSVKSYPSMLYTSILYLPGIPLMTHSFSQVYKRIISCYPIYNKIEFQKKNNDFLNLKKKLRTDILHPVKYLMPNVSTFSKLTQLVRLEWLHYTEHYTCCHLTQGSAQVYASELGAEVLSLST